MVACFFCTAIPISGMHPKIGLVLGGGGAKGAATIGALKVIEQSGVKIDYISGTSIGAVIGGMYAAGFSLDEIEKYLFPLEQVDALDINHIESEIRRQLRNRSCEYIQNTRIPFRCVAVDIDEMDFWRKMGQTSFARCSRKKVKNMLSRYMDTFEPQIFRLPMRKH